MIRKSLKLFLLALVFSAGSAWAETNITDKELAQWRIGAGTKGFILPKKSWKAAKGRAYSIKNLEVRKFLQYEPSGTFGGINLGWTDNASAATADKSTRWFFARASGAQTPITYGERIAIGWGNQDSPFIHYANRKIGINLDWSKSPVYEWVILGGEPGSPVGLDQDTVILFNMKHRQPLIYFDRTVGGDIGWPDSTRWNGPMDEIMDGLEWTAEELLDELESSFVVCKANPVCIAKLKAYQGYMLQLRLNVDHYKLPKKYQNLLVGFYPDLTSLGGYRFGLSTRQPEGNATTDCSRTYYSDKGYVDRLRKGTLKSSDFRLLLHEIQHYDQCKRVGGRPWFAKMWFADMELSALKGNITDMRKLHDGMPMEKEAENVAQDICSRITEC